jgi:hypothetical protein
MANDDNHGPWFTVRYALVFVTWGVVTWNYYSFHHELHSIQFKFPPTNSTHTGGHGSYSNSATSGGDESDHDHGQHNEGHGKGGPFGRIHERYDPILLYGLALPIALLTLAAVVWTPLYIHHQLTTHKSKTRILNNATGDFNIRKWTIIWFILPLFLVMLDGARYHFKLHNSFHGGGGSEGTADEPLWHKWYIAVCMSLMSPSGYAATWSLALFLIPVTKHSPILDWLRVTPVQALAFHRLSGWVGFWNSCLHGFLHLRHLMDVLDPQRMRSRYQQLVYLLMPSSPWKCVATQSPFRIGYFFGERDEPLIPNDMDGRQCWLALVNSTGMISVLAYLVLAITSLPYVRRHYYEWFYRVHIPAAWIMLIMAIWHYPTCALILIPNILYYLSFHIPVSTKQAMDRIEGGVTMKDMHSSLVEANLIEGGSIELVFVTSDDDTDRHEATFVKIYHPAISPLYHPFSVYSPQELFADREQIFPYSTKTRSILLRPEGLFTEGLTKMFFPTTFANNPTTLDVGENNHSPAENIEDALISSPTLGSRGDEPRMPSSHDQLQFESYYAGSYDWVEAAADVHDEILLVAGGVGIVPFLEFLPNLKKRLQEIHTEPPSDGLTDEEEPKEKMIHLHWCCREVGLASYVWHKYLRHHVNAWERDEECLQAKLKIHLHLSSLPNDGDDNDDDDDHTTPSSTAGEDILTSNVDGGIGLVQKNTYPYVDVAVGTVSSSSSQEAITSVRRRAYVHDAPLAQSWVVGLLVPGSLMLMGTILHWSWYQRIIMNEKFRDDFLVVRSHSIVFTLALALAVSVMFELYQRRRLRQAPGDYQCLPHDADAASPTSSSIEPLPDAPSSRRLVVVRKGRPNMEKMIAPILNADRPGVYMCGSHSLMDSVRGAIGRHRRQQCAFYHEDSEM